VQWGYDDTPPDGMLDGAWQDTLDPARANGLRMARVGLVMGTRVPVRFTSSSAQIPGGQPQVAAKGYLLRGVTGTVTLRNLLIFY
jgi:hypothetical protein